MTKFKLYYPTLFFLSLFLGLAALSGSTLLPAEAAFLGGSPVLTKTLEFDGTGDALTIPDESALRLSGGQFSIEAWVKPTDTVGCKTIISKGFAASSYWVGMCGGVLRVYTNGSAYDANTVVPAGLWTHVAVTKNTTGTLYIYINGEVDRTVTGVPNPSGGNTKPLTIGADPDSHVIFGGAPTRYEFEGKIANVRLWSVNRSRSQIRRDMHTTSEGTHAGLIANWWLADDFSDEIGGFDAAGEGNPRFDSSEGPPAQPDRPLINTDFDSGFGYNRANAARAYLPTTDEWLILGGRTSGSTVDSGIRRFDPQTGRSMHIDRLPRGIQDANAAYAPTTDRVYMFGGRTSSSFADVIDTIYEINPHDGTAVALAASLPVATANAAVVYHEPSEKIVILGGANSSSTYLDTIYLFDPAAGTISTLPQTLPNVAYKSSAVFSKATGKIYLFGGALGLNNIDSIVAIALNSDATGATMTTLTTTLPSGNYAMGAVVDPITHLIYLVGGRETRVLVFDPLSEELFITRFHLPQRRYDPVVMYGRRQRAAYVLSGSSGFSPSSNLWRIPLGDGPAVPAGRWDFPAPVGSEVTALDGAADAMVVGTTTTRAWRYDSNGTRYQYSAGQVGSGIIYDVDFDPETGKKIFATAGNGVKIHISGVMQTIDGSALGGGTPLSVEYAPQTGEPFIGTDTQGLRRLENNATVGYVWRESFANLPIQDIERDRSDSVFVIINEDGNERLGRLFYADNFGLGREYPNSVCGLDNPQQMTFGGDGSYWIAGNTGGEFDPDAGVCYIPPGSTPSGGTRFTPLIGDQAVGIDTDLDGRVWVAVDEGVDRTGGAIVYESNSAVTTTEFNYLNAPLGGNEIITHGSPRPWTSAVSAVAANDERVWFGQPDGDLITLAPRWDQLDDANSMNGRIIQNVWTVRGRLFAATSSDLHILQPDGHSWTTLASGKVWDIMGDSQGRVWVGTQTGIRLYTPTGWDYLTDRVGSRPATAVYTLAEDHDGRVWIGGQHGLTLFDRDRFVATLDPATSGLPTAQIRTLFVDSDNMLWIGTDLGLTRFDGTAWTTFTTASGLPDNRVADIEQTGDGRLAISTASGLSFYDGSTFVTQSLPIPANRLPLTVDENDRLWAGSAVEVGDGEWQRYSPLNSGMASVALSDHAADGADRIWFAHAPSFGVSVRSSYLPPLTDSVPVITSVEPAFGSAGDRITIHGSGFGRSYRDLDVFFGRGGAQIEELRSDRVVVTLNDDASSGDVVVKVGARQGARTDAFCAIPVINEFTPTGGNVGVQVQIFGTNFDRDARVSIGSAAPTVSYYRSATELGFDISSGDPNGALTVQNHCSGGTYSATSTGRQFRRIDLQLDEINLNQGINGMALVADRPTMVSFFLRTTNGGANVVPLSTEEIDINQILLTFNEPGGQTWSTNITFEGPVPTSFLPINNIMRADITNAVNVSITPNLDGDTGSPVLVSATLRNRGRVAASGAVSRSFSRNRRLGILMVPIMRNGFSRSDLTGMQGNVNNELEDIRRRMMPMGNVDLYWSPSAVQIGDLFGSPSQLDPGEFFGLYDSGHSMERFRRHWNRANPDRKVTIAFGVIDGMILDPNSGASGLAFWPDVSAMLNALGLSSLDTLCDIGDALVGILTLGFFGGGGCDLEVPMYVAWGASNTGRSSHLIGHEAGHVLGLVRPVAANGSVTDNFSHSVNDEIDGGECGSLQSMGSSATYNVNKTLYRQPGVQLPIVNPLVNNQWAPRLATATTLTFNQPTTFTVTSEAFTMRAKSIMSYACGRGNRQSYFEPADGGFLNAGYRFAPNTPADRRPEGMVTSGITAVPTLIPGDRLFVSGVVSKTVDAGQLIHVENLGDSGSVDASYETGYALVQRDAAGVELARTGLFPIFASSAMAHQHEAGQPVTPAESGFFAATVIAQSGIARLELVKDGSVLDTFAAGSGLPTVAISTPTGGKYGSGEITLKWSAADPDGDDLTNAVYFSADDGAEWMPIAFPADNSSGLKIPVDSLVGTERGRFKVVVSDGFNVAEAISNSFIVAAQPPQPYIGAPADGSMFLEGSIVSLSGGAFTNLGDPVADSGLQWHSSRDGSLGGGSAIDANLSVGTHHITLIATSSDGGRGTTMITLTVVGDYDFDGVADSEELDEGMSLFDQYDSRSDLDQDGVPWLQERNWGTDPNAWDSDGDGRNDGAEIEAGSDPSTADAPPAADELTVSVSALTYDSDEAVATPDPQTVVSVMSRGPVAWQVTANRSWIQFSKTSGTTTDSLTVIVEASTLPNGIHTGEITFTSPIGTEVIPLTLTVTNSDIDPSELSKRIFIPIISR